MEGMEGGGSRSFPTRGEGGEQQQGRSRTGKEGAAELPLLGSLGGNNKQNHRCRERRRPVKGGKQVEKKRAGKASMLAKYGELHRERAGVHQRPDEHAARTQRRHTKSLTGVKTVKFNASLNGK